ncbi:predicted protein [Nematostella vectensis]|uniref:Immunoglobulin-binding protein 1 n=1 Tax=Nematostella vectensis TaxID=45351 RepID=A7RHJ2_NEMVE|nr:predicted protein [Nematostella vectensis]|eukprot:XP_001640923.1 predicted protein [Nematostella vectensis]
MAVHSDIASLSLSQRFEQGFELHEKIETSDEPSSSDRVQSQISSCIECLMKATEMVNTLGLFSSNEELEEITTLNLRYLLLPALMGDLSIRQTTTDRLTAVKSAKIYFTDYLERCQDYGLHKNNIPNSAAAAPSSSRSLHQQANAREEKIKRYKEQKQLESKLKELKNIMKNTSSSVTVDDENQRECNIVLLKLWVNKALEQLSTIEDELQILEHMAKMKAGKVPEEPPSQQQRKPMKPILITREMLQSKVFGAGYPSLPTMSQEEYLEKEIREGKVVMEYNQNAQGQSASRADGETKSDSDGDDEDNPEKLQKARDWDDWKDDNRRGWGNRENMG